MTNHSFNANASLQAMPLALVFPTQRLLTQTASATPQTGSAGDGMMESLTIRATRLTSILEDIPGYDHSGLNE